MIGVYRTAKSRRGRVRKESGEDHESVRMRTMYLISTTEPDALRRFANER